MPSAKGACKAPIRTDVHISVFYRCNESNFLLIARVRRYGNSDQWRNRVEVPVLNAMSVKQSGKSRVTFAQQGATQ
ncbi:MAG: hypothetical protein V7688_04715 [Alcanivorax jadensis]|uniref:hypothetical protein n=1 Tax=Alcanivorax jadensis TaxID=64988 RepID=UPI0030021994